MSLQASNPSAPAALAPKGTAEAATEAARASTLLSPRFYTTDFKAMDRLDLGPLREEWDALMAEYEGDNNHDHFQRDAAFLPELEQAMAGWTPALREEFLDFLISSVTSEFSGCVLYQEVARRIEHPELRRLMRYMARDESRHAGFINQSLKDFGMGVDLGALKRTKPATFFKPKFIYYATYLSEKIGYARYITIFRQLERHPEKRFHPIFRWFERWCNDEFRHGESFALILRAQPELLRGANLLWVRFFLLAVYATMYVRDHTRPLLHEAMGLDPDGYDFEVFRITTEIARQVFPLSLQTDAPGFRAGLQRLAELATRLEAAKARGGLVGGLQRLGLAAQGLATFVRLYLHPVDRHPLPAQIRVAPAW